MLEGHILGLKNSIFFLKLSLIKNNPSAILNRQWLQHICCAVQIVCSNNSLRRAHSVSKQVLSFLFLLLIWKFRVVFSSRYGTCSTYHENPVADHHKEIQECLEFQGPSVFCSLRDIISYTKSSWKKRPFRVWCLSGTKQRLNYFGR